MLVEELLQSEPYVLPPSKKDSPFLNGLKELTDAHASACEKYRRAVAVMFPDGVDARTLEQVPYLPVSLFKTHKLVSVPDSEIFQVLTSSGTTSAVPSRIYLDRKTAALQKKALARIMTSYLGPKRLPMLIADTPSVIRDRTSFSARGAGILGMMSYGHDHFYALNDDLTLNFEGLVAWLERYSGEPLLIFGFTFMVWEYFVETLRSRSRREFDLSKAILIHSGGWKKLQNRAVSPVKFKSDLRELFGLSRVHNFYGMVEQVGSVFVECEHGFFHCPSFADIVIRSASDWKSCDINQSGLIQVCSLLPHSYPGHSLLTEDMGILRGFDGCSCGRRGRYFEVLGRIPKAEVRGCSDAYPA